jgi:hypothetical protein
MPNGIDLSIRAEELHDLIHNAQQELTANNLGAGYGYLKQAKEKLDALCEAL